MGRGRPKKTEARHHICPIRLNQSDLYILDYMADRTGLSRAEVMRRALKVHYNLAKMGVERTDVTDDFEDFDE